MERLPGRFLVALACEGRVRVMSAVMQGPADELRERHGLEAPSARLAAEAVVASVLLSSHIKGEERLTVDLRSEHPPFAFLCDVDAVGTIRGRFTPARTTTQRTFQGVMSVAKSLGPKELYRGLAEIREESLEAALHRYMTESQQVDARVRVMADVKPDGEVTFAAGLLVERLPGMDPAEFAALFDEPLQSDFKSIMTGFAFGQLAGSPIELLGTQDFVYKCTCSRERVVNMLRTLGPAELLSMVESEGQAEVNCHFCAERYVVTGEELVALAAEGNGSAEA